MAFEYGGKCKECLGSGVVDDGEPGERISVHACGCQDSARYGYDYDYYPADDYAPLDDVGYPRSSDFQPA